MTPRLERLGDADRSALVALPRVVGWGDTEADWRTILASGVVLGHRAGGRLVSCGARFDYGSVVSVGKMLVHPDWQGRGLGSLVLGALLDGRPDRDALPLLGATVQGERLYARRGFERVGSIIKLFGPAPPGPAEADVGTLADAVRLDRLAFGGDRARVLGPRWRQARRRVADRHTFGLAVAQGALTVVGPLVAPDVDAAEALFVRLAVGAPGEIRVDIPASQPALVERVVARGFRVDREPPLMTLGGRRPPGDRARLFALMAHAFG